MVTANHVAHGTRTVSNPSVVILFYSKESGDTMEHISPTDIPKHQINSGHNIQCFF